jgi:hypothetical protein
VWSHGFVARSAGLRLFANPPPELMLTLTDTVFDALELKRWPDSQIHVVESRSH